MGYLGAKAMSEEADLEVALHWHLTANHYPPIPGVMVEVAKRAVELARTGRWTRTILLPKGVKYKGQTRIGVHDAVESMHLHAFLD